MLKQNTVADNAVFCSLMVLAGILMGVFGHQTWVNATRRNRQEWEANMSRNPAWQPTPLKKSSKSKISYHTDESL